MSSMSELFPFFHNLGAWNWLIIGALLLGLEILAPGAFLVWFGLAALAVGGIALGLNVAWQMQLVLFAVLSLILVVLARRYLRAHDDESENPLLNQRGAQNIGRSFALHEAIVNGRGVVRIADSIWQVEGKDCPQGAMVKVIGAQGNILQVEAE